jgi:hypothetical protein
MFEGDFDTIDQAIATLRKATITSPQQVSQSEPVIAKAAYDGAREDLAIWKRRALEAEKKVATYDQRIVDIGVIAMTPIAAPIDNVAEALEKANIPDARKFIFHGLNGCSNHGCIVHGPRTGMGTNGPCHCISELSRQQSNMLGQRLDHFLRALIPTQANRTEG